MYIEGTNESINALKNISKVARGLSYGAGVIGFALSYDEYHSKKKSGQLLALDGVMTVLSFTGAGAPISAVYFILIRTDTKDKYFAPKPEDVYELSRVKIDKTSVRN